MDDLYQEIILHESKHPQNQGVIDDADLVVTGGNKSCGDEVTVYLKLSDDKQQIVDLKWQGSGCAISQSAMSLLSQKVASGQWTAADLQQKELPDVLELLGLDSISPGRMKCVSLGVSTLQKIG